MILAATATLTKEPPTMRKTTRHPPMHQDRLHPEYDEAMELLCSLSANPRGTSVAALVKDFQVERHQDIRVIGHALTSRGFMVRIQNRLPSGRVMTIHPRSAAAAEAACQQYWQTVYGD